MCGLVLLWESSWRELSLLVNQRAKSECKTRANVIVRCSNENCSILNVLFLLVTLSISAVGGFLSPVYYLYYTYFWPRRARTSWFPVLIAARQSNVYRSTGRLASICLMKRKDLRNLARKTTNCSNLVRRKYTHHCRNSCRNKTEVQRWTIKWFFSQRQRRQLMSYHKGISYAVPEQQASWSACWTVRTVSRPGFLENQFALVSCQLGFLTRLSLA